MKPNYLFSLLSIFFVSNLYGQHKVEFLTPASNLIYIDVPSLIKITLDGKLLKAKDYQIELSKNTWEKIVLADTFYTKTDSGVLIHPWSYANRLVVKDRKGRAIDSLEFHHEFAPEFKIMTDNFNRARNTKEEFLISKTVLAFTRQLDYTFLYHVDSYKAAVTIGNEKLSFMCKGNIIPDTVKYYIRKMRSWDKIELSDFRLSPYRIENEKITYPIWNETANIIYDYERYTGQDLGPSTLDTNDYTSLLISSEDIVSSISKSDCDAHKDTCTLEQTYTYNNGLSIITSYKYKGADSVRAKLYVNHILLADINFVGKDKDGLATIYNPRGQKIMEGNNTRMVPPWQDTIMTVNPITWDEEQIYQPNTISRKSGEWIYYKNGLVSKRLYHIRLEDEIELEGITSSYNKLIEDYQRETKEDLTGKCVKPITSNIISTSSESNCTLNSDTCTIKRVCNYANKLSLTFYYKVLGKDSMQVQMFMQGILLADITYWHDKPIGKAIIYGLDGNRLIEGSYGINSSVIMDSELHLNPVTLEQERGYITNYQSYRIGEWIYYKNGVVTKQVYYKDGEVISSPHK